MIKIKSSSISNYRWQRKGFCMPLAVCFVIIGSHAGVRLQTQLVDQRRLVQEECAYWQNKSKTLGLIQKMLQAHQTHWQEAGFDIHQEKNGYRIKAKDGQHFWIHGR